MAGVRDHGSTLEVLNASLPRIDCTGPLTDTAEQARAALTIVLDRAVACRDEKAKVVAVDPATCPNCGSAVHSNRTPYCSDPCREQAAFVRQMRAALDSGSVFESDRQIALGQKLWVLLGGGYPHRTNLVPARTLTKVLSRYDGRCEGCGAPANTIDHTGTG